MSADDTDVVLPLDGWRVLVPRTPEQAAATVFALARFGARGEAVPTIRLVPPEDQGRLVAALAGMCAGEFDWVVLTSVNAVAAVRHSLIEQGYADPESGAAAFERVRVASVGGVTGKALARWGVRSDLMPKQRFSAAGLVEAWPVARGDGNTAVLLPRADIATDVLPKGLRAHGWEPVDVPAYRTVPASPPPPEVRAAVTGGGFDAVLFTSASTVRNLVAMAGRPHPSTVIACIGAESRAAAEELGLQVRVVAPRASSDALVEALAAYGREGQGRARR